MVRDQHRTIHLLLPLSQEDSVHPASQPLSHRPVSWLHVLLSLQCPAHFCTHLTPYHPSSHSNQNRKFVWMIDISKFIEWKSLNYRKWGSLAVSMLSSTFCLIIFKYETFKLLPNNQNITYSRICCTWTQYFKKILKTYMWDIAF